MLESILKSSELKWLSVHQLSYYNVFMISIKCSIITYSQGTCALYNTSHHMLESILKSSALSRSGRVANDVRTSSTYCRLEGVCVCCVRVRLDSMDGFTRRRRRFWPGVARFGRRPGHQLRVVTPNAPGQTHTRACLCGRGMWMWLCAIVAVGFPTTINMISQ